MAGDVKVLLVTSGGVSKALVEELQRLSVVVTECAFSEAEELLETSEQDLVALLGARGAIELANMIDDLDDGPKMVIVAERKELAKLRGLNRDVVVSLFAMETTEKVVGQRIESLARRAHRRNEQKEGPAEPKVQKTSLGLPSAAAAVGKVNLKKPPGVAPPPITEAEPPSSGNHPGAEPPTPTPAETAPAEVAPLEEIDDSLLESILPDAPDEPSAVTPEALVTENIPMMSVGPGDEEAVEAQPQPPSPEEHQTATAKKELSLKIDPGDLDLTSAESALENLDSVKLDITEDIVQHAKAFVEDETKTGDEPIESESSESESSEASPEVDHELDVDDFESIRPGAPDEDPSDSPTEDEVELGTSEEAVSSQDVDSSAEREVVEKPAAAAPQAVDSGASPVTPTSKPSAKKDGGGNTFGIIAALMLLAGGAGAGFKYFQKSEAARAEQRLEAGTREAGVKVSKSTADGAPSGNEQPTAAATSADESNATNKEGADNDASAGHLGDAATEASDGKGGPTTDDVANGDPSPSALPSRSSLDNPFKMPDTSKPSCDVLLTNNAPQAGPDPINEASQIWADARKAIVAGKKDQANLLMCQAVSLNPSSAAVEGLAHHYLGVGSYAEALKWVDKADAVRPGQLEMGNLRGDIHGLMGDIDKARSVWLETLNIRQDESSRIGGVSKDYSVEAGRHLRRGDLIRAELFFRRAVILDMENLNGIIGLAKTYHRLEKLDYTQAFCELSLKVSDMIPEVHVLLGDLAQARGNRTEAKQRYERALAVRPGFFPAKRGLAEVK